MRRGRGTFEDVNGPGPTHLIAQWPQHIAHVSGPQRLRLLRGLDPLPQCAARRRMSGRRGSSPALPRMSRYAWYESAKRALCSPSRTRP